MGASAARHHELLLSFVRLKCAPIIAFCYNSKDSTHFSSIINFANILLPALVDFDLAGFELYVLHPKAPSTFHFPIAVTDAPSGVHDL